MSVDYRLVGGAPAPACHQDVMCAVRYVHASADKHNVDPSRIFLIGQSAGSHLAALAATLGDGPCGRTGGWEDASDAIAAAVCVAGPFDLVGDHCGPSAVSTWAHYWEPRSSVAFAPWTQLLHEMSSSPPVDGEVARRLASPINHVTSSTPPLLIFASACDYSAPLANSEAMVAAMQTAGTSRV
jgi:acetyl esterase/lipase